MTAQTLTRRWVLAGLGAGLAAPSLATAQSGTTADLVAKANLTGTTGFCVADLAAGEILGLLQQDPAAWFSRGGDADEAGHSVFLLRLLASAADAPTLGSMRRQCGH